MVLGINIIYSIRFIVDIECYNYFFVYILLLMIWKIWIRFGEKNVKMRM